MDSQLSEKYRLLGEHVVTRAEWRETMERFKSKELPTHWRNQYPFLFSQQDFDILKNQNSFLAEWWGAALIYESTGMHALVDKYGHHGGSGTWPEKQAILADYVTPEQQQSLTKRRPENGSTPPDLFLFDPKHQQSCMMCECKSPTDKLRTKQCELFDILQETTGIEVVQFRFRYPDVT
ncbi:MAG: VRR-NUC domain-containing protein [Pirellulaceae bacterium]